MQRRPGNACDVVPAGDVVPTQLANTFLTDDGASSLIVHGDRLFFVTGGNEIDMAKTTPGSSSSLLMETHHHANEQQRHELRLPRAA
jgi:hypothetical protein